jgi:Rad3-related DNA helicase
VQLKQLRPSELTVQDVLECFPSSSLRRYQKEIIEAAVQAFSSGKKCVILTAPTGFGKSYVNASLASVTRSFYATPQLALIDQMLRDPSLRSRFVEIKGRRNYPCHYEPQRSVHIGRCATEDYECKERFEVCPYWLQKARAIKAPSVLLSFAYLVAEGQTEGHSESYLGTRTLLVLDEAHNIEEECLNHVSVNVTPFTIPSETYAKVLPQLREVKTEKQLDKLLETVEASLKAQLEQVRKIAETTGLSVMQAEDKERIERYLETYGLYKSSKSEWVWQVKGDQLFMQPLFAREFMKELIWKRAEHYIISSATILNPQEYVELIGLHDLLEKDEICILPQVPSTFPVENRPVIDRTVGPLSRAGWEQNMLKAVQAVQEILREERGNVAIHCHSYDHQKALRAPTRVKSKSLTFAIVAGCEPDPKYAKPLSGSMTATLTPSLGSKVSVPARVKSESLTFTILDAPPPSAPIPKYTKPLTVSITAESGSPSSRTSVWTRAKSETLIFNMRVCG